MGRLLNDLIMTVRYGIIKIEKERERYNMHTLMMGFAWTVIGLCGLGMFALGCIVIYGIYAEIWHLVYKHRSVR